MAYQNLGSPYYDSWSQENQTGQSSGTYAHNSTGYSNRSHAYSQPGPDVPCSSQTQQHGRTASLQYPYSTQGAYAVPYLQGVSTSNVACPATSPVNGYPVVHHRSPYGHATGHYNQQTSAWTYPQHSQAVSGPQGVLQSNHVASPVQYASPQLPLAPRMHVGSDTGYASPGNWSTSGSSIPGSSTGHQIAPGRQTGSGAEFVVPCPYDCGTVLTGVHAVGNMTRHLKSQNCIGSGKDKTKYICPMPGCDKRYIRSDGLKVHLRKRHDISHASDRNGSSEYEDGGYS